MAAINGPFKIERVALKTRAHLVGWWLTLVPCFV